MKSFVLKPRLAFDIDGRCYWYDKRLVNNRLAFTNETGEQLLLTEREFYRKYDTRELVVDLDQPYLGTVPEVVNAPPDLTCFSEDHQEEALRRHKYIDHTVDASRERLDPEKLNPAAIAKVADEIGEKKKPPSIGTLKRWFRNYRRGNSVVGLVPRHERKGRQTVIVGELENIVLDVVNERYLKEERHLVSEICKEVKGRIDTHNEKVPPSQKLHMPSSMTVYRYINRLNPYLVDCARFGKYAADRKFREALTKFQVDLILDRWEIDHTLLDVLIVDSETGKVVGRPYVTVVIDVASRMVMAFVLHFAAPNTETVLRVIERAIRPKDDWLAKHPEITSEWRAKGLPLRMCPDNAAEFHAGGLVLAFNDLGISLFYPRSRGPEMKGTVERFFRTLNTGLIHRIPGTTFSNVRERGDYPSEQMACMTLPALEKAILKWVVDVYHQRPHKGLAGRTPAQAWKIGEGARPIRLPADLDALESVLACRDTRPIHHYGIEYDCQFYNCPELGELSHRLGPDDKVEIRYRDELGHIWVRDEARKLFLQVPCKDKRMVGLSRELHELARKRAKKTGGATYDADAVLAAYRQILGEFDDAKRSNKARKRKAAAISKLNRSGEERRQTSLPPVQQNPRNLAFDRGALSGFAVRAKA